MNLLNNQHRHNTNVSSTSFSRALFASFAMLSLIISHSWAVVAPGGKSGTATMAQYAVFVENGLTSGVLIPLGTITLRNGVSYSTKKILGALRVTGNKYKDNRLYLYPQMKAQRPLKFSYSVVFEKLANRTGPILLSTVPQERAKATFIVLEWQQQEHCFKAFSAAQCAIWLEGIFITEKMDQKVIGLNLSIQISGKNLTVTSTNSNGEKQIDLTSSQLTEDLAGGLPGLVIYPGTYFRNLAISIMADSLHENPYKKSFGSCPL